MNCAAADLYVVRLFLHDRQVGTLPEALPRATAQAFVVSYNAALNRRHRSARLCRYQVEVNRPGSQQRFVLPAPQREEP